MSATKPALHDTHLKTALKHAPDAEAQPSSNLRIEVLNYANRAVKPRKTWLQALKQWLLKDHFANAQRAGLTGVAAILLVSVLLWREHPEELVWITAAPQPTPENSPVTGDEPINHAENITLESAPASASVVMDATSEAQTSQSEGTVDLNKGASAIQTAKAQKRTLTTEQDALNKQIQAAQAPMATAPAPATISQPAEAQVENKDEARSIALQQAPMAQADAQALPAHLPEIENADPSRNKIAAINETKTAHLEKNKSKLKATPNTDPNLTGISLEIQNLLNEMIEQGGAQVATRDIAAGKLRVLHLKLQASAQANHSIPCQLISQHQVAIDAITGYTQEQITLCTISPELNQAVEDYNQTMKNWQVQHAN